MAGPLVVIVLTGAGDGEVVAGATADAHRVVAVATRDLEPGEVVAADDVRWSALPEDAVPPNALGPGGDPADRPEGRVVVATVDEGEVLSRRRLAPDGARGLAALVPAGSVAVAVTVDATTPDLERGQRVDVLTTAAPGPTAGDPFGPGDPASAAGSGARRIATRALVIDAGDERILVAVTDAEAPAVAAALLDGAVVLALTGAG